MNITKQWLQYPIISKQLTSVNQFINENIQTHHQDLQKALLTMADNGGKYLRPALLFLSAEAAGEKDKIDNDQLIQLAASIEILHMATLIHDDIIDEADERRGQASIQTHFGKDVAVYAGDLLFTHFFDLILRAGADRIYLSKNAHTMHHILDGELSQMGARFNQAQTIEQYIANVKGKTAALLKLAAEEGAYFAGADAKKTQLMAEFGEKIGIAFQIVDDILDYTGSKNFNKPTLEDLKTGVYSLPILLALQNNDLKLALKKLLDKKDQMTSADISEVQSLLLNSSIIDESRAFAKKYTDEAVQILNQLPHSSAQKTLLKITNKLLTRTL
ncbi:trans-hexaprenyltranstransferase [Lactobacillus pasteurii DSM 23907 = CRBIP 24.76]|uniref:Polyprenyl synthetase family protein n=1 Tax=Lactobacillus pasteurii DSM 23907 = CRBIP 24.76 TaxID=1423790 RepID=I7KKA9_9LACO|nr:polyprenyl synthetase family protein [Lactobacillus pasteurii]KRK07923.1 trans-hexaprenyltranstransferase [Lactobacillus pasteurii DSM 23907 = CRBIP 24.76]TDG77912.1 hypothetical protein C5L33_001717 [Lactobacillus pasteurii]CCI84309.1 Polyprenyl synthetase family protein [Lactobacillus pasteurii DSM 23907 = CRBIP 24.76]